MFGRLKRFARGNIPGAPQKVSHEPAPLFIARRERLIGNHHWFEAKSWFGGMPRLGGQQWPLNERGEPLHFVAQLDLSEIAMTASGQSALPTNGALAFFVGILTADRLGGRIVHVNSPNSNASAAPRDLPSVEDIGGDPFVDLTNVYGPTAFPYWPVEFRALPAQSRPDAGDHDAVEKAILHQTEAISRLYPQRAYNFSASYVAQEYAPGDVPLFWLAALMYAERVPRMRDRVAAQRLRGQDYVAKSLTRLDTLDKGLPPPVGQGPFGDVAKERANSESWLAAGLEAIAEADSQAAVVDAYVAKVVESVQADDPWQLISPDEAARLDLLFAEAHNNALEPFSRYLLPRDWRDYATEAIKLMAAGPEDAFARLPEAWRTITNARYRTSIDYPHLMFGIGANIQGNEMFEYPDMKMVLQLGFDDMMYWRFGDNGVCQFWMPETALSAADFSKALVTFEAH